MADINKDRENKNYEAPDKNRENMPQDDPNRQGQWGRPQDDNEHINKTPGVGENKEENEDDEQ
jgi:hypothetical protein